MKKTLKVFTTDVLVPDYEALDGGVRRFIGRAFDASVGEAGGWVPKTDCSEIPSTAEYRQAVKQGELTPADELTAKLCGVKFVQV